MRTFILLPALLIVTACGETQHRDSSTAASTASIATAALPPGCYADSAGIISLMLDSATANGQVSGSLRIAIPEKDARNGDIRGLRGPDGIVRAVYRFMQEGVTDSITMHFRQRDGDARTLDLRASAYDAQTGREYPDSSQAFPANTVPLRLGSCAGR